MNHQAWNGSFPISEVFYSVQGEGCLIGMPSIFIRLSYCNLRCVWCDTPYTSWQPEATKMTLDQIVSQVRQYPCGHVVITGGEPFLYASLSQLCEALSEYHLTIETNATRYHATNADLISMSPKLSHSTPTGRWQTRHEKMRLQPEVIRRFLEHYECQVKFVVATPQDLGEIRTLVERIPIPPSSVILMPESRTVEDIHKRQDWLIEICKREGYRYSTRLHIEIWGNERGK